MVRSIISGAALAGPGRRRRRSPGGQAGWAGGSTNGEIADRLFLSPRTVASHLYRAYPKLGIAGRHQLRDLVGEAEDRPR
jgi:Bacterial regulatory proteins, luxR family